MTTPAPPRSGAGSPGPARPETFDLTGPLPTGTTVLEASAGTGKTHTIAALASRYVAEGHCRLEDLMLVTFGRAATAELRERVRERFLATAAALADPGAARGGDDPVVTHLASVPDDEVTRRRHRLVTALAGFDAATIATTHGFCHQMLAGLGIAADVDPDATFAETASDLLADTVTDLYVRTFGLPDSRPADFDFATASRVAADAVEDRAARLEPTAARPPHVAAVRRGLAEAVRAEVDRRKRFGRVLDYDDLLLRLRDALADPVTGSHARERIRSRYQVVLVDEFQDTDPVQWDIVRLVFHEHRTLVLIGDPKQAIYAFRGADVVTYLRARQAAATAATLGTSWRSDQPLVEALHLLMGGVALGDTGIVVHDVAARHRRARLHGAPDDAPLRLRVVTRRDVDTDRNGRIPVRLSRPLIARDLADDVVALLASGATLETDGAGAAPRPVQPGDARRPVQPGDAPRPVQPGDVAVLVQRNEDARTVRDALRAVGVPAVVTGTSSVFGTAAAREWLTLLTALEQPHRAGLVRSAALTSFVGWSAADLVAGDQDFEDLSTRVRGWARLLATRGVAALYEAVVSGTGLPARVLAGHTGERHLTDLGHLAQALHTAAVEGRLGVASLVSWLRRRMDEALGDVDEERSRRLESDAAAVQVVTVHRSKGLEFPVVYAPYLADRYVPAKPDPLRLHDPSGERVLDVGGPTGEGYPDRRRVALAEEAGESLRLAYVALTRARSQVVTWWAPTANTDCSALHRLLFAGPASRGPSGGTSAAAALPDRVAVPSDAQVHARLTALAGSSGGRISVAPAAPAGGGRWAPEPASPEGLRARGFTRVLDDTWTRTSYSGLTAGLHDQPATVGLSEAESPGTLDEPEAGLPVLAGPPPDALPSPMAQLPVGAAFGTLVHGVLEGLELTAADLPAALLDRCRAAEPLRYAGVPAETLADALLPALRTPLGPLAGGRSLSQVPPADVLAESAFEFPLGGGESPGSRDPATLARVAGLLERHLDAGDPLRGYAADLASPAVERRPLRGFLGGFVDAVLRVRDPGGRPAYLVVDYKTNRLAAPGEPLTSWHYQPAALVRAMRASHYPLQALLYTVALHRYLRWRQPGYDPDVHLGGTLYLFLRGMCGPDTPVVDGVPAGVFSWRAPTALVTDLSALLDGTLPDGADA